MAQKVVVELVDDLDGTASQDVATVTFGLDGVQYEIDLKDDHADQLRHLLASYVAAGRRTGGRIKRQTTATTTKPAAPGNREQTKAIRDWARQNGFELGDRGRIPTHIIDAFDDAHKAPVKPKSKKRKPAAA
jgi:nucleoid-associated protein Lsr2